MKGWKKWVFVFVAVFLLNLILVFTPDAQNNNAGSGGTTLFRPKANIKQWHQTK